MIRNLNTLLSCVLGVILLEGCNLNNGPNLLPPLAYIASARMLPNQYFYLDAGKPYIHYEIQQDVLRITKLADGSYSLRSPSIKIALTPRTRYLYSQEMAADQLMGVAFPELLLHDAKETAVGYISPRKRISGTMKWDRYFIEFETPDNVNGAIIFLARCYNFHGGQLSIRHASLKVSGK